MRGKAEEMRAAMDFASGRCHRQVWSLVNRHRIGPSSFPFRLDQGNGAKTKKK
jgi:hypothetical protein